MGAMGAYWSVGLFVLVLGCVYFAVRLLRSADEAERERHQAQAEERWSDTLGSRQPLGDPQETAPAVLSPPEDRGFADPGRRRTG